MIFWASVGARSLDFLSLPKFRLGLFCAHQNINLNLIPTLFLPLEIASVGCQLGGLICCVIQVLCVCRIQEERFESESLYRKACENYVINDKTMHRAKPGMRVLHPLPRKFEISTEFDTDERAAYFRQAENGLYVRMALLTMVLGSWWRTRLESFSFHYFLLLLFNFFLSSKIRQSCGILILFEPISFDFIFFSFWLH